MDLPYIHPDNLNKDLSTSDLERLDNSCIDLFISNINNNYRSSFTEIELRAFQDSPSYGGFTNTLNKYQYDLLCKYFENNCITSEKINSLDISVHSNNFVDLNDNYLNKLRFTLLGKKAIRDYCRTNTIPDKCSLIFTDRFNWHNDEYIDQLQDSYNRQFNPKIHTELKQSRGSVDLFSIKSRLGGKIEIPFNYTLGKFDESVLKKNDHLKKLVNMANKEYPLHVDNFQNYFKTFRLKDRNSYLIDDNIRIDLTKVKSSKKDVDTRYRYNDIPVQKFIDSSISEQKESYEFEIEILNTDVLKVAVFKQKIMKCIELIKTSGILIKEKFGYTHFNLHKIVLESYKNFIKKIILDRINSKITTVNQFIENTESKMKLASDNLYENLLKNKLASSDRTSFPNILQRTKKYLTNQSSDILSKCDSFNIDVLYISPKVVSMDMDNIRKNNPSSIHYEYCVTDKADGISSLLYINCEETADPLIKNRIFLIDSNLEIHNTNIRIYDKDSSKFGVAIFNGEFLTKNKVGFPINKFGIYDTYVWNSQDVCNDILCSNDDSKLSRIKMAQNFVDLLSSCIEFNINNLEIFVKKFYIPTDTKDIFECTKQIWNDESMNQKEYKLDGTIYTPINSPVGFSRSKDNYDLYQGRTWEQNIKWKPSDQNSIDFLLNFKKEVINTYGNSSIKKVITKFIREDIEGIDSSDHECLIALFYTTGKKIIKKDPCEIPSKRIIYDKNSHGSVSIVPTQFIQDINTSEVLDEAYFKVEYDPNTNHKYVLGIEDNSVIEDDTIVEVSYENFNPSKSDYNPNKYTRFKILKTRHDKTYMYRTVTDFQKKEFKIISKIIDIIVKFNNNEFFINKECKKFISLNAHKLYHRSKFYIDTRNGKLDLLSLKNQDDLIKFLISNIDEIKSLYQSERDVQNLPKSYKMNFGNGSEVANSIWKSIHNPISVKMITGSEDIPTVSEDEDKYYNNLNNHRRYKSTTLPLQDFHNKIIKSKVLIGNAIKLLKKDSSKSKIHLLDLACGKGGDIGKWIVNKIDHCIGIDVNRNNIYDNNNGACERVNFYKRKEYLNSNTDIKFLVGDLSKRMAELNYLGKLTAGPAFKDPKFKDMYNDLWYNTLPDKPNYSKRKFDVISIMFALHYFFENETILDNIIHNINDNLNVGGLLIGACFDGKSVFDKLSLKKNNNTIQGFKNGEWIWKIDKKFTKESFKDDTSSLGMSIDVTMISIGKIIPEFLVNFNYFIERLKILGIELLSPEECDDLDLPSVEGVKKSTGLFESIFNMDNDELKDIDPKMLNNIKSNLDSHDDSQKNNPMKEISFLNRFFIFRKRNNVQKDKTIKEDTSLKVDSSVKDSDSNLEEKDNISDTASVKSVKTEYLDTSKLKVNELKTELRSRGLNTSGLKKDLKQRLDEFLEK